MVRLRDVFREAFRATRSVPFDSAVVVMLWFVLSLLGYFSAIYMKEFIDFIVAGYEFTTILMIGLALLLISFASYIMNFFAEYTLAGRLSVKGFVRFSRRMLNSLYNVKYEAFYLKGGDIIARFLSDLSELAQKLPAVIPSILVQIVRLGMIIFILYSLSPQLLILSLILIIPYYIVYRVTAGRITRYSRLERTSLSKLVDSFKNAVDYLPFIKRINAYNYFSAKISTTLRRWARYVLKYIFNRVFAEMSYGHLGDIFRIVVLIVGAWLVIQGYTTIGSVIAFTSVMGNLYEPVMNLTLTITYLTALIPYLERYYEVLNLEREELYRGEKLEKVNEIELANVILVLRDKQVLKNVSLRLRRGEWIGIVGPIGSGKTSLALLLVRFYEPSKSYVLINGKDYTKYSIASLRRRIIYISSKEPILDATLRENILMGMDCAEEELRKVLGMVGIDFAKPDDIIDPEKLSAGQRQKIALARALIRKPDVLILDEATNSLDTRSEFAILNKLKSFLRNSSVIIISHRFSSLKNTDKIYVLKDGEVIMSGVHEELMEKCSLYAQLVKTYTMK